jgi:peptidoglycan hydrolase-like protein with peptidoglycan-binding domain
MKQIIGGLLLCCLLVGNSVISQEASLFTVQIGNFVDAKASDFEGIRPMGMIYARRFENNIHQVYIGGYAKREDAEKIAEQLRGRGYANARVVEIPVTEGRTVTVIQMETIDARRPIAWEKYASFQNLYAIIYEGLVRIVAGPYASNDEARADLARIRAIGFSDAFLKRVNTAFLQRISTFETGQKQPLIPLAISAEATQRQAPAAREQASPPQGSTEFAARSAPASTVRAAPPSSVYPDIRANVKRRSALELQKALKAENYYTGPLDGLYGPGTAKAYEQALQSNRELQKYRVLAANLEQFSRPAAKKDSVQDAIDNLISDPKAPATLERAQTPLSKAYQAYLLFTTKGLGAEVNTLMNTAIKQAFVGKKLRNQPPFDFKATYAYNDLDQLLSHLLFLHVAPDVDQTVPCWLYRRHPREAGRAMLAALRGGAMVNAQNCDPFMDWEEVRMMTAMAADIHIGKKDADRASQASADRARLYLSAEPLSNVEQQQIENWNRKLWEGIEKWAASDPIHQRTAEAFKIVFFQSLARMEDFYMDRGVAPEKAKPMALATLKTLVGHHLERFA